MKKQFIKTALSVSLAFIAWSCDQKDPVAKGDYVQGVFVINEGNFSQNNGSISHFTREESVADADIYSLVNGSALNGGIQGYAISNDNGIILVDNSAAGMDNITIVNSNSFEKIATIGSPEIENPREVVVLPNSSKAYISCWGTNADYTYKTGYIAVLDLTTQKIIKKIDIVSGPENLVINNGKLFVGTTSYGAGKNLTVIDTATDQISSTVNLTGAPSPIGIDANGKLWVSFGNNVSRLSPDTYSIETTLPIGTDATKSAGNFAFSADRKTVFFVISYYDAAFVAHGETYKFGIADTQVNVTTPFIKRIFTGLSVDPTQGLIYAAVTPSFAQSGYAVRYRTDGSLVDSIKVGIAPTGFFFK